MENNLRKPLFYFRNWFFLWICFFTFPIFSESPISLQSIDVSSYPEVKLRLHLKGNLDLNGYTLSEQLGSTARFSEGFGFTRLEKKNPLYLTISVPSYSNAEDRRWLLQLTSQLVKISEQSGGFSKLHIQSDDSFHVFERIRSQVLDVSFPYPKEKIPQFPIRNWEQLLQSIPGNETKEDHILLLVSFSNEWPDRFEIPEFAKRIREKGLKLIVLSPSSLEANKLVSYANGDFYPISKQESFESLFLDLKETVSPDWEIKYISPWQLSVWKENEVVGSFTSVPTGVQFEFLYQITPFQTLYLKVSDPFVFFPVSLFFILLCIASLYYLRGFESPNPSHAKQKTLTPISNLENLERQDELEVYDRMYGETLEKAARDREIALVTKEKENLPGTSYTYAVIQVREGNQLYEPIPLQWSEMTIGNFESNHIVLHDPSVSGLHAKVKNRKGKFILFDCVSEAGVYLNGRKLLRPKVLHNLDEIQLGKTILTFRGRY
ncbi:FHA domain-containing protein [Leptospira biflexa]|uniref:FHA domain-containing protein n=1 Tax=Leptospira biflexa TaxID=172 RepID=UPI00109112FB|nr:FHA domain-containing protein [Leptospira biflexa]TGM54350.1 FHA domain-containing protein [Leptospira biflexa]